MKKKILVIDDTKVIRDFLKDIFSEMDFKVETAKNGQQGLEKATGEDYELVFCDIHMPDMNGLDLITKLKQTKTEIPVIMMDSLPGMHTQKINEVGALGCLAKPFDINELRTMVNNIFERGKTNT